jgi:hypothetical protein
MLFHTKISAKKADGGLSSENESILISEQRRVVSDRTTSVCCSLVSITSGFSPIVL